MTPIATAVAPLKISAVEQARAQAQRMIDRGLAALEAAGWDLNVAAPLPRGTMGRAEYKQAQARREFLARIAASVKPCRMHGEPHIVSPSQEGAARFVAQCEAEAAGSFDAFVAKLEQKVGDHTAARMLVDGTWSYSVVEVETPAGLQRWKTQQIINVSGLGTLFNQWPTRLIK